MTNPQLTQEISQLHADICSALADPNRILLIYALAKKPRSVNDLAQELDISQPATSRNLKVLRDRGLVFSVRQGTSLEYRLTDTRLVDALKCCVMYCVIGLRIVPTSWRVLMRSIRLSIQLNYPFFLP